MSVSQKPWAGFSEEEKKGINITFHTFKVVGSLIASCTSGIYSCRVFWSTGDKGISSIMLPHSSWRWWPKVVVRVIIIYNIEKTYVPVNLGITEAKAHLLSSWGINTWLTECCWHPDAWPWGNAFTDILGSFYIALKSKFNASYLFLTVVAQPCFIHANACSTVRILYLSRHIASLRSNLLYAQGNVCFAQSGTCLTYG